MGREIVEPRERRIQAPEAEQAHRLELAWPCLWQVPVTIVWGYACVLGMIWMAAKIFRVGVLMYGKPPSPLQLLKWLRYR